MLSLHNSYNVSSVPASAPLGMVILVLPLPATYQVDINIRLSLNQINELCQVVV